MCFFYLIGASLYLQKELANNPNCPHMCAYKLVTVEFKWFGLQTQVEKIIQKVQNCCFFSKWKISFLIYIYIDNLFCFEFEMPQNTRHVPQMPFLFLTVTIVPMFHFLTHLLCLSRWRSVCLPTSTDNCSAGLTNGLICQWMTFDAWRRRQRRSWMR